MKIAILHSPKWAEFAAINVYSIFKNNPAPVKVYLVSDGNGYIDMTKICIYFGQGYKVEYINAEEMYEKKITSDINVEARFSKYALYRLLVPHLIEDDRIMILDTDTIVHGDISEYFNIDMGNNLIAGVLDTGVDQKHVKDPLGLSIDDIYINNGITLLNLKALKEIGMHEKWTYELSNKFYIGHDQCIQNTTCKDRILLVDKKYNYGISTGLDENVTDIRIYHFGGNKPWVDTSVPNYHIWEQYAMEYKWLMN